MFTNPTRKIVEQPAAPLQLPEGTKSIEETQKSSEKEEEKQEEKKEEKSEEKSSEGGDKHLVHKWWENMNKNRSRRKINKDEDPTVKDEETPVATRSIDGTTPKTALPSTAASKKASDDDLSTSSSSSSSSSSKRRVFFVLVFLVAILSIGNWSAATSRTNLIQTGAPQEQEQLLSLAASSSSKPRRFLLGGRAKTQPPPPPPPLQAQPAATESTSSSFFSSSYFTLSSSSSVVEAEPEKNAMESTGPIKTVQQILNKQILRPIKAVLRLLKNLFRKKRQE